MAHFPKVTSRTEMACWPDDIKSWTNEYSKWHHIDQCFNPAHEVACPAAAPTPNIRIAMAEARRKIVDPANTPEEKSFWLAFIMHLVGDAHQPLHTTSLYSARFPDSDLGGNLFYVRIKNDTERVRLHAWHDTVGNLIAFSWPARPLAANPTDADAVTAMASRLLKETFADPSMPTNLNVDVWLQEGFEAATVHSYLDGKLVFDAPLTPTYVDTMQKLLIKKVALGGRRLAALLTDIYNEMKNTN